MNTSEDILIAVEPAAEPRKTYTWRFEFTGATNVAARQAAEAALKAAGFSVGSRQRGAPSGILFGDYMIAKWRNMNAQERADLHGRMFADELPVIVHFSPQPPAIDDAIFALHEALLSQQTVQVEQIIEE